MEDKKDSPDPLPQDIQSGPAIRHLVDTFYTNVRQDNLIGPIFEETVEDWGKHLPTMYRFWEKLLFNVPDYDGNPFQKHLSLPVQPPHFTRWIELFTQTVDDHFAGPKAEEAKTFARKIASTFQLRMGLKPENPEWAVPNYTRG
ncbi:MAG: group III truncated hemoglobin [Candidatus Nitrohelix vancouverensis]|uniref:Group III truncated hemoglobin n=1 Tax=Candidatus Nitrohelix vancouverensis TaxID=2705534 RepID=A0A7T0G2F9_9BACT|nr:MAG: group III truncated hemoglobin [Candidatus Nitrohelix vancouverensis]